MMTDAMGKNYSRKRGGDGHGWECCKREFREDLTEKMTFDQWPKERGVGSQMGNQRKSSLGKGNSKCKSSGSRVGLVYYLTMSSKANTTTWSDDERAEGMKQRGDWGFPFCGLESYN